MLNKYHYWWWYCYYIIFITWKYCGGLWSLLRVDGFEWDFDWWEIASVWNKLDTNMKMGNKKTCLVSGGGRPMWLGHEACGAVVWGEPRLERGVGAKCERYHWLHEWFTLYSVLWTRWKACTFWGGGWHDHTYILWWELIYYAGGVRTKRVPGDHLGTDFHRKTDINEDLEW